MQLTGDVYAEPPSDVESEPPAEGYLLSVTPSLLKNGDVNLEVQTNIPGAIEVMAGINLSGQAGDDVWIGKSERVAVTQGKATVVFGTEDLPQGKYDAEASFYPLWGFKDNASRATGIEENLAASASVTIHGSGESVATAQARNEGQKWVMEHVAMGDPWRPADWLKRFGQHEEIPIDSVSLNPRIIKAYYFSKIDMTLVVNTLKNEIVIWRTGRANR